LTFGQKDADPYQIWLMTAIEECVPEAKRLTGCDIAIQKSIREGTVMRFLSLFSHTHTHTHTGHHPSITPDSLVFAARVGAMTKLRDRAVEVRFLMLCFFFL
jgi:hypothetical protein